jgi:16S rRNA (guanine1207-N2)-methyltransferase
MSAMAEHYFTASPTSAQSPRAVVVDAWGHRLDLESVAGVFSAGRLDKGTAVLFREAMPAVGGGTLLDLGCGYGAIACALASAVPSARVWAVDVNERALETLRGNAERLGLAGRIHPALPDGVPDDVVFDEIWSNPPIRIGKPALHALLLRWLGRLSPTGRAVLVVGKNLGADSLQRWLTEQGFACERLGSAKGFRVLDVRRTAR